jgi:hypothetical protein
MQAMAISRAPGLRIADDALELWDMPVHMIPDDGAPRCLPHLPPRPAEPRRNDPRARV